MVKIKKTIDDMLDAIKDPAYLIEEERRRKEEYVKRSRAYIDERQQEIDRAHKTRFEIEKLRAELEMTKERYRRESIQDWIGDNSSNILGITSSRQGTTNSDRISAMSLGIYDQIRNAPITGNVRLENNSNTTNQQDWTTINFNNED